MSSADWDIDELKFLWDQYKYRHELCWSAVYKLAAAVLALGVIPYVKDELTVLLGCWMIAPPVLGVGLAAFGVAFVRNELARFAETKVAFHALQNLFLTARIADVKEREAVLRKFEQGKERSTPFDRYVMGFTGVLLVVTVANALFVAFKWIPHFVMPPP